MYFPLVGFSVKPKMINVFPCEKMEQDSFKVAHQVPKSKVYLRTRR